MMKLVCIAVIVAVASADVSHLLNQPLAYQQNKPIQYYKQIPATVDPAFYVQPQVISTYTRTGEAAARILKSDSDIRPDGSYGYAYDTENGIAAQETGGLKQVGNDVVAVVQGSYRYTAPDGSVVETVYVADENGFQPSGNAIPTPHPIPEVILRSIQFNEANARIEDPRYKKYNTK